MILLGSTGSIGVNTLHIAREFGLRVEALVAGKNVELLNRQIEEFKPKLVAIGDKNLVKKVNHPNVFVGNEGILNLLENSSSPLVINALVGFMGLFPTVKALELGKELALANKESLVAAGAFLDTSKIVPIDSEHFGLWYLKSHRKAKRLCITASGGAFRDTPLEKLKYMKPKDALKHPNWKMGQKITIDSASMVNKLFELLEARWLFKASSYDAIIETKSIIHALIDYEDGSTTAHLAGQDMKLPIAFALLKEVDSNILPNVDLLQIKSFEFKEIKTDRYPVWELKDTLMQNPKLGAVINGANESMIEHFLKEKCSIIDLAKGVIKAAQKFENMLPNSVSEVYEIDKEVREFCKKLH